MFRKLLTSSSRVRIIPRVSNSSSSIAGSNGAGRPEIELSTYHEASDNKLEELSDKLEEILEERYDQGADVSLNNGVLTVVVDEHNTYVINKQTPNRQLWLSSPISGPKRFDLSHDGKWVDRQNSIELGSLLSQELTKLLKLKHDL